MLLLLSSDGKRTHLLFINIHWTLMMCDSDRKQQQEWEVSFCGAKSSTGAEALWQMDCAKPTRDLGC
jgi:hypothetical protein